MKEKYSTAKVFLMALTVFFGFGCGQSGLLDDSEFRKEPELTQIREKYIVVFKQPSQLMAQSSLTSFAAVKATMANIEDQFQLQSASQVFSEALHGGVYEITELQAMELAKHSNVAYVEKDQVVSINTTQTGVTWGLDRLDQANLPLNQVYTVETILGAVVNAYVIDTGVLTTHEEFQGRAASGFDFVDNDEDATDCNGHGTHVAGTIGSRQYGVAKNINIIGVRVLDCGGSGTYSGVIAGVEWVTKNHVSPAVANMSLGGPISQALEDAIAASIKSGVTFVVAAGNENVSACLGSPAHLSSAIKVGSTTNRDERSSFSNFGECVDIFAPGSDITSTWWTGSTATNTISGTSMATPHAAGVAALYLARNPTATPAGVKAALLQGALQGKVFSAGAGSPNRLLNTLFLEKRPPEENDSQLKNQIPTRSIAGARGDRKYFTFLVPENKRSLTVEMTGGTGDADLYVKFGEKATTTNYDCRPYRSGNSEKCVINSPLAGTYSVMLNGYTNYSGVVMKGTFK